MKEWISIHRKGVFLTFMFLLAFIVNQCTKTEYIDFGGLQSNVSRYSDKVVEIRGYMSPLIGATENYFYLTQTPYDYSITVGDIFEDNLPVYLKVTNRVDTSKVKYTNKQIRVRGKLILGEYVDNNQYKSCYRLIDAVVTEEDSSTKWDTYTIFSNNHVFEDLEMYYSMFYIFANQGTPDDFEVVDTDIFNNYVLFFAIADKEHVVIPEKDKLSDIINLEKEMTDKINMGKIDDSLREDCIKLRELLDSYYENFKVC